MAGLQIQRMYQKCTIYLFRPLLSKIDEKSYCTTCLSNILELSFLIKVKVVVHYDLQLQSKHSNMSGEFESVEKSLEKHLPPGELAEVRRILFGKELRLVL
jgi:hypothetical protein